MEPTNEWETNVYATWSMGDFKRATELVLESYGSELRAFVLGQFRGQAARGEDAYLDFCEDFWRAFPEFGWRCPVRAWCYKLARSAAARAHKSPHERPGRRTAIGDAPELETLVAEARTTTALYMQTSIKDRVRQLRAELSQDDRDLLTLRVDRKLSWREVAHALGNESETATEAELARLETALRQRFTDVKNRLRRLAVENGML